jgi:hypothetical protein
VVIAGFAAVDTFAASGFYRKVALLEIAEITVRGVPQIWCWGGGKPGEAISVPFFGFAK